MTIDLTPEELETIIDALEDSRRESLSAAEMNGVSRQKRYRDAAERCAALLKRLGEIQLSSVPSSQSLDDRIVSAFNNRSTMEVNDLVERFGGKAREAAVRLILAGPLEVTPDRKLRLRDTTKDGKTDEEVGR